MANNFRLDTSLITRDRQKEQLFGIDDLKFRGNVNSVGSIHIVGEIIAAKRPKSDFTLVCTIYDHDGDIMLTEDCRPYGTGLVTSMIRAQTFFNRFPFSFDTNCVNVKEIRNIHITVEKEY